MNSGIIEFLKMINIKNKNEISSWLNDDNGYVFYVYEDDSKKQRFIGNPVKCSIELLEIVESLLPKYQKIDGMVREIINQIDTDVFLSCLEKCIIYSKSFYSPIMIRMYENRRYIELNAFKSKGDNNGEILVGYLKSIKRLPSNPDRIIKKYKDKNLIESYKDHGSKVYRLYFLDNKESRMLNKRNVDLNDTEEYILRILNHKDIINRDYIVNESGLSKSCVSSNLASLLLKGKIRRIGSKYSPRTFYIKNIK